MAEATTEDTKTQNQETENQETEKPQTEASASTPTRRRTPQPEGQTLPGGGGTPSDAGFDEPVTPQGPTALNEPTITRQKESDETDFRKSTIVKNFTKISGYRASQVLAANERTHVIVTDNGGKYQLNRKGNQVRHLQGPPVPNTFQGKDLGDTYVDARARSPFTGTAASINASVHTSPFATRGEVANQAEQDVVSAELALEQARERAENSRAAAGD